MALLFVRSPCKLNRCRGGGDWPDGCASSREVIGFQGREVEESGAGVGRRVAPEGAGDGRRKANGKTMRAAAPEVTTSAGEKGGKTGRRKAEGGRQARRRIAGWRIKSTYLHKELAPSKPRWYNCMEAHKTSKEND